MRMYHETEEGMRERALEDAKLRAYETICPAYMSRAERRTAKGRMLVAQAEAAMLRAELDFLKNEMAL